jgi:type I restriction enzyme S subunit
VYLPEYSEQVKIGDLLYSIEQKIQINRRINDNLLQQAKILYNYWFTQKTGINYYLDSNYLNKNVISLPIGWSIQKVSEAYDICYGYPFNAELFTYDSTAIPIVRIRDIPTGIPETYTTEITDSKYMLRKSDLLIGMDGNFHMNLWCLQGAWLNQRCIRIRKKNLPVLLAYFSTMPFIKSRESNVSRTTVGHLSAGDIDDLVVLIPPEEIFNQVMPIFDSIAENICLNRLENQSLISYRNWLLPMLMNGQATIED